jgi:hypothetical protein
MKNPFVFGEASLPTVALRVDEAEAIGPLVHCK